MNNFIAGDIVLGIYRSEPDDPRVFSIKKVFVPPGYAQLNWYTRFSYLARRKVLREKEASIDTDLYSKLTILYRASKDKVEVRLG